MRDRDKDTAIVGGLWEAFRGDIQRAQAAPPRNAKHKIVKKKKQTKYHQKRTQQIQLSSGLCFMQIIFVRDVF